MCCQEQWSKDNKHWNIKCKQIELKDTMIWNVTMITYSYSDPRSCYPPPPPPHPALPPPSYTEHQRFKYPLLKVHHQFDFRSKSESSNEQVTILLRCPPLSACFWCVKLYSTVLAGCIILLSILWVSGHSYVLYQTEEANLRVQR